MNIRPESKIPETNFGDDSSKFNPEMAHEESIKEYMRNSELGVLTQEQMGIISLIEGWEVVGIDLPGTKQFFDKQRRLSSGEDGKARIQCKEIITAGAFPMSLLFGEKKPGWIESLGSLISGKKPESQQQSMR